jgi:hypothetical protein
MNSSAGGQVEQPSEVKSSRRIGTGVVSGDAVAAGEFAAKGEERNRRAIDRAGKIREARREFEMGVGDLSGEGSNSAWS